MCVSQEAQHRQPRRPDGRRGRPPTARGTVALARASLLGSGAATAVPCPQCSHGARSAAMGPGMQPWGLLSEVPWKAPIPLRLTIQEGRLAPAPNVHGTVCVLCVESLLCSESVCEACVVYLECIARMYLACEVRYCINYCFKHAIKGNELI